MKNEQLSQPLLWESALKWLLERIRVYYVPLLSSLIAGFLAYTYAFTNKLPNHDETFSLFSKGATYGSGRWGLEILEWIFPNFSMPWIYGVITLLLLAAAVCVIVNLFHIRSKLLQGLLGSCILVFPSLTATFGYMFTASSYGVSFLLAVTAVWLLRFRGKNGALFALGCMVLSLSIYQSYISITAGLLVLILVQQLLEGAHVPQVLRRGVGYLVFLAVALGLYFAATLCVNRLKGVGFNSYSSGNLQLTPSAILGSIGQAYAGFFRYFSSGEQGLLTTAYSRFFHLLSALAAVVLLLNWVFRQKNPQWGRLLLLAVLVALLPLAINCMFLFTAPEAVHTLVLYGFVSVYVLMVILAEASLALPQLPSRISLHVLTLGLAAIVLSNIYTANRVSLYMHLQYENTYGFYTALAADLKASPEFTEDTKLAIVGDYPRPDYFYEQFADISELAGVNALHPDVYSKDKFLEYYLGLKLPFATDEEIAQITATEEYAQMPSYPYYGCMKTFGDIMVVKLG